MSNRSNREQKMYVTGDTHGDEARMRCREFAYNHYFSIYQQVVDKC